jgi:hypothetical protein
MFMDMWQQNVEMEQLNRLSKDLGVLWTREDVEAYTNAQEQPKGRPASPNEMRVPLALSVEPSLMETVRKSFGRKLGIDPPSWAGTGEVVELYDELKDPQDFLNFVRTYVRPVALANPKMSGR